MEIEFDFNVPAEHNTLGQTDLFLKVQAKQVFPGFIHAEIAELPLYQLGLLQGPLGLQAKIEALAKEKFEAGPVQELEPAETFTYCV